MSENKKDRCGTDILSDIVAYAYETDSLPSDKEAEVYLAANKIDNSSLEQWGLDKLRAIKARQKLKAAAEGYLQFAERFAVVKAKLGADISERRKRIMGKINALASDDPQAAMVYCRKFEDIPEEDLLDLEAEISMLEELEDESEK